MATVYMRLSHKKDSFLAYLHIFGILHHYSFCTKKPAFNILLICTKKVNTTGRIIISIVDKAI